MRSNLVRKRVLQDTRRENDSNHRSSQNDQSNRFPRTRTSTPRHRETPPASPDQISNVITIEDPEGAYGNENTSPQVAPLSRAEMTNFLDKLKTFTHKDFLEPIEKTPIFWAHLDTHHLGSELSVRRAVDLFDRKEKVFIKKFNHNAKTSYVKFPVSQLEDFLRCSLIRMYEKIQKIPPIELFGLNVTHDTYDEEFWNHHTVTRNPGGDIYIRPFFSKWDSHISFRLQQKLGRTSTFKSQLTGEDVSWGGPQFTLSSGVMLGFIAILGTVLNEFWEDQEKKDKEQSFQD